MVSSLMRFFFFIYFTFLSLGYFLDLFSFYILLFLFPFFISPLLFMIGSACLILFFFFTSFDLFFLFFILSSLFLLLFFLSSYLISFLDISLWIFYLRSREHIRHENQRPVVSLGRVQTDRQMTT